MNTKRRFNCYVFGNLIVSFLTLNLLTNPTSTVLVQKTANTKLNKIYEKEIEYIETPDTIISTNENVISYQISNNVPSIKTYNYEKPSYNSLTGSNLVNYAMKFIGLRYVSAGNSLSTGTDCSGFTSLIYQEFGISLGRTVSSQLYSGSYVSRNDLQPGDLVFYSYGSVASHVAIYIGNGLIIHESTPRDGVKISSVNIMNYITARRLITSSVENSSVIEDSKEEVVVVSEPKEEVVEEKQEELVIEPSVDEIKTETEVIEEVIEEDNEQEETSILEETEASLEINNE